MNAVMAIAAGMGTMILTGLATTGGYVQTTYDWITSSTETQSQVTAMGEEIKAMKEADKLRLVAAEADRRLAEDLARKLQSRIDEAQRQGSDITKLQDDLHAVESRVSELNGAMSVLRERRSSR